MLAARIGLRLRCVPGVSASSLLSRPSPAYSTLSTRLQRRRGQLNFPLAAIYARRSYATSPPPETDATPASPTLPSGTEPLTDSISDPLSLTDAIVNQITPLAYGDFATDGLSSWSPIGILTWSYELLHVSTGLPWFYTIIAGSAFWRFFCLPFAVTNIRATARIRPFQPSILDARNRMTTAQQNRDAIELQRANVEMKKIYAQAGVNPVTGMILPMLAQLPVTIGMFFALKRMCTAGLEQMKYSGVAVNLDLPWTGPVTWLQDLTIADPTYILPALFTVFVNLQIYVGARDMDAASSSGGTGHLMNLFRALSIVGGYLMSAFPSGLFLGLITTTSLTIAQSGVLRSNAVRRLFGIPEIVKGGEGRLPSFAESIRYVRKSIEEASARKEEEEARRGPGGIRRAPPGKKL